MDDITSTQKLIENVALLGELLGVSNLNNGIKKLQKIIKERDLYKAEVEEFCAIVGLEGLRQRGNAKTKIRNLLLQVAGDVSSSYGLDVSFLDRVGNMWDNKGEGNTPDAMIRSWEGKIARQRETVKDAYTYCLRLVESKAREAGYSEEDIQAEVTDWHNAMVEDFDLLTSPEFWLEYRGKFLGAEITLGDKENKVPVADALRIVQEYAPASLYASVVESGRSLGTVSDTQFTAWENVCNRAKTKPLTEGRAEMQELMVSVIGLCVHRMFVEANSTPSPSQQGALFAILAPEEINSTGSEFCVDDGTSLTEVAGYYTQLIGAHRD